MYNMKYIEQIDSTETYHKARILKFVI
jgi:hypothetical protein